MTSGWQGVWKFFSGRGHVMWLGGPCAFPWSKIERVGFVVWTVYYSG